MTQKSRGRIGFSREDVLRIQSHGQTVRRVLSTFRLIRQGRISVRLVRPCTLGDGVVRIPSSAIPQLLLKYERACAGGRITKFVASSGAATRMFRCAIRFREMGDCTRKLLTKIAAAGDPDARDLLSFMKNLRRLALFPTLKSLGVAKGFDVQKMLSAGAYREIIEILLAPSGLGFSDCPKGLVPFHLYPDGARTPFEEHLAEASKYIRDSRGIVRVHFTVRPGYARLVRMHLTQAKNRLSNDNTSFVVTLSQQKPCTDSPGLSPQDKPVRDPDGNLVFFPGGHGSLVANLAALRGDIVFIRTIDNILHGRFQDAAIRYRKVLAGYLLELQEKSFRYLKLLKSGIVSDGLLEQIRGFLETELFVCSPPAFFRSSHSDKARWLFERLNRPLRVCGVVQHRGEAGGGPFWVGERDATCSLQMVEGAQVDTGNSAQVRIWDSATHFNAADIVCGLRDFRGRPFDLRRYVDGRAALIAVKSVAGERVRILEHPGLWNGGMSHWNSVFVQIPRSALHPVKSILDLLEARHRL